MFLRKIWLLLSNKKKRLCRIFICIEPSIANAFIIFEHLVYK